jgi:hypothetical protein
MAYRRGHVTGHKKERKGSHDWYQQIEEENIHKIEAEWQKRQEPERPPRCCGERCSTIPAAALRS